MVLNPKLRGWFPPAPHHVHQKRQTMQHHALGQAGSPNHQCWLKKLLDDLPSAYESKSLD